MSKMKYRALTGSDFDVGMVIESMTHVLQKSESIALKKALFKALGLACTRKPRNRGKAATNFTNS